MGTVQWQLVIGRGNLKNSLAFRAAGFLSKPIFACSEASIAARAGKFYHLDLPITMGVPIRMCFPQTFVARPAQLHSRTDPKAQLLHQPIGRGESYNRLRLSILLCVTAPKQKININEIPFFPYRVARGPANSENQLGALGARLISPQMVATFAV